MKSGFRSTCVAQYGCQLFIEGLLGSIVTVTKEGEMASVTPPTRRVDAG